MEGLENILKVGEAEKDAGNTGGTNLYAAYIDQAGGLDKIETLQTHQNNDIYEKAVKILENYFGLDDEDDEDLAPEVDDGQQVYTFGSGQDGPPGGFKFN